MFAIFGHGNVTCLGQALEEARDELPTWRGQNEQGMALAAVGFAKAMRRRQIMIATSSIGPGATNMVTAAAVAHSNRLPLLLMSGDTFRSRIPDPVLQQVEHFHDPSMSVNDAFKAVTRYWDRIASPEQVVHSLPHAVATMLDPAIVRSRVPRPSAGRPGRGVRVPRRLLRRRRARDRSGRAPTVRQIESAAAVIRSAERPLIICGGGVHYSFAESELQAFAERFRIPVVETVAGKATLVAAHPLNAGPGRSDRVPVGERARRRGRRRDRGRLAAAGLHDRFVDRVPTLGAVRRHQHRRVRRHQALEHAGDRRRTRDARSS